MDLAFDQLHAPPEPKVAYGPEHVRQLILEGHADAVPQRGVHDTFVGRVNGFEFFYKDYGVKLKPALMLAEGLAHTLAGRSAMLFYRVPLGGYRADPAQRSQDEASALTMWRNSGIYAPRVYDADAGGLLLERIRGENLETHLTNGTLDESHVDELTESLHRVREAAYLTGNEHLLHSDPALTNAILDEKERRVALIDPGIVMRRLPIGELDAATSLNYLNNLHESGIRTGREDYAMHLAERYVEGLEPDAKERMLERNVPVPRRAVRIVSRIPGAETYARWLGSYGAHRAESIEHLLR